LDFSSRRPSGRGNCRSCVLSQILARSSGGSPCAVARPGGSAPPRPLKEFIEEASNCYLHALQHHEPDISLLVALYAKMSRMRVLASTRVLATAEAALRRIIETYSETDVTLTDTNLRTMVQKGSFDLLHDFGEACREESDLFGQAILNDRTQNVRLRVFSALGPALRRPTGC
jgi:hypothetical protein